MSRPLVSVVTGTWQRHELLLEAIENVRQQTYRPLEHVIVADGPDEALKHQVKFGAVAQSDGERFVPIIFQELGFHSSTVLTNSISAAPFMTAQLLARGEYQVWLADDERWLDPDAIANMVDTLEAYDSDFVYPRVEMTWPGSDKRAVIGTNPPRNGQVTHMLYRRDALDKGALFRTHVGSGTDWDAFARLMSSGCRWAFIPEILLTHMVHKVVALGVLASALWQGWL